MRLARSIIRMLAIPVITGLFGVLVFFAASNQQALAKTKAPQTFSGLTFSSSSPMSKNLFAISFTATTPELKLKTADKPLPIVELLASPTPDDETKPTTTPTPFIGQVSNAEISVKTIEEDPAAFATPPPAGGLTPQSADIQPASSSLQLSNGGLNADVLFGMVQAHRQAMGLAPFEKDARSCALAVARAPEVGNEIATGHMHAGMYGRSLPYWNTENIISMNSEQGAFHWWINDAIHREAIEGNYKYSCLACSGNSCAEEFTNFQPK